MGYFDALASGSFKTAHDGSRLFFPWGIWGRGYVMASEQAYARLRQQMKTYYVVTLVLIVGSAVVKIYSAAVIAVLLVGFYVVWMRFLLPRLQPTNEGMSLRESMSTQAHVHSAAGLWLLEIISLVLAGGGVLSIILDPSNWLLAFPSIGFFGGCAFVFARMLRLRRASAEAPHPGET